MQIMFKNIKTEGAIFEIKCFPFTYNRHSDMIRQKAFSNSISFKARIIKSGFFSDTF